jgi:magnesium-transporting ATPase (P-type)
MDALKRLSAPTVKVRRNGHVWEVSARELVPGDVVLLEAGNLVPADGRLLEGTNLRVQESALTGESEPVEKDPVALEEEDPPLGERANMVYSSTVVTKGRGLYVVTETGMATELGKIAAIIQTASPEQTPLQRRLDQVGKVLALAALVIVGVVFALGLLRGEDLELMFLTAVSLAVAAVPEGLPAVVTIALALGAQRMLRRRALIRKLPALVSLGVGVWYQQTEPEIWQTMVFTTLTLSQMSHVMAIRSGDESLFRVGLRSNKLLLGAVILTFMLQVLAIYVPFFQGFLETQALPIADFAIAVALSTVIFWAVEVEKWLLRRKNSY